MSDQPDARRPLRTLTALAVASAATCAAAVAGRRRALRRRDGDPPDRHLAAEQMEALATGEGMPEASEG
jgi:hypothetical protein